MKIYTVTTLRGALAAGKRTVGYYEKFEEAEDVVLNNICDICEEGYYHFAVIEEVEPGIYMVPRTEIWYKWNREKGQYENIIEKPDRFKQIAGWSMG